MPESRPGLPAAGCTAADLNDGGGVKRVLLSGMSGTVKSTVMDALAARGDTAIDADSDEWKEALHLVSARASANRLVLAQVPVDEQSNELTALPGLLGALVLAGFVVTIDAMWCHRPIDQQILGQGVDDVLALGRRTPLEGSSTTRQPPWTKGMGASSTGGCR